MNCVKTLGAACLTFGLLGAAAGDALAAPAVTSASGTWADGQTVVITGAGFGIKAVASPVQWDRFETGAVGASISGQAPLIGQNWSVYSSSGVAPRYSNAVTRANSARSSLHDFTTDASYNSSLKLWLTQNSYYFSFWWYYDKISSDWSRNVKPWIMYGSAADQPIVYSGWGDPALGDGAWRSNMIDSGMSTASTAWSGTSISSIAEKWVRIECYLVQSSPNQADGLYQCWAHTGSAIGAPNLQVSPARTRISSNYWNNLHIGSYNSTGTHSAKIYVDDVYVDNTRARVEICDAPQWSARTRCEVQVPTSWSPSTVTIKVNPGAFLASESAYAYVVDADGNTNAQGFSVSWNSSGPTQAPPPPHGVERTDSAQPAQ